MKIFQQELKLKTKQRVEIIDITESIDKVVKQSGIKNGLCFVNVLHATSCVIINENEQGLLKDIKAKIEELFQGNYKHDQIDDNAKAHLVSAFIGQSCNYPIKDSHLVRGTWQNCLFLELDGPRERRIFLTIFGET
ncbi:MAG: secondary thiamine-phosphate synthase enzyme YjbQ [Candidatus Pacearchaeota archaeon]